MAMKNAFFFVAFFFFLVHANAQSLSLNFYSKSCPSVEQIVSQTTAEIIKASPLLAPSFLRMHFHDCFVRGCDASVLIDSTAKNTAEKDSAPDVTLRGFQQIDTVKAAVEKACPGVVSCADILALVARDAISSIKGPFWEVPLGRRDGTVSLASEALANIPAPFFNINQLASSFASKGLTVKDLVVLSGAHTIGRSHCSSFSNRIYNFSQKNPIDPTLNPQFAATLRQECPATGNLQNIIINMDEITPETFDINYYTLVKENRGLFQSDAALLDNPTTDSYVQQHSASAFQPAFFNDFAESMVKMGNIGVLTGSQGQIRKICSAVN